MSSSPGLSRTLAAQLDRARSEGRRVIVTGAAGIANQPRSAWHETIVDSHDLEMIRAPRMMGEGLAARINVGRAHRFEARSLRSVHAFLVCSDVEKRAALAAEPDANVHVLANGVPDDLTSFPTPRAPRAYFVGKLDYAPNHEGLHWLAERVWPSVLAEVPDAELLVAGSGTLPAPTAAALRACRGVSLLGELDSIGELQRQAGLAVVPILAGGGTRLKLLEACAGARAVVTTPLGAEGLDLPEFVPVSPSPAEFARETIRRLLDHDLVEREGLKLREWVDDKRWTTLVANVLVPILTNGSKPETGRR